MPWEVFKGPRPRKRRFYGRLRADMRAAQLYIGKRLSEAGFDTTLRYFLFYDRDNHLVGLRAAANEDDEAAFKFRHSQTTVTRFCRHFGLTEDYEILKAEKIDGMWVLHLNGTDQKTS